MKKLASTFSATVQGYNMQNCACITYLSISNFLNKQAACKSSTSILLAVIERHIAGKPANKISTSSLNHNNPKLTCQMVFDGRRIDRVTAGSPVIDEIM